MDTNERQTAAGEMIMGSTLRDALRRSANGQSGLNVYGYARTDGREFRIVEFKTHRGLAYGRELSTGKWVVIGRWSER